MQHLEALLEEGALQPRGKSRLILQQESGWIVRVALVALLRTDAILGDLRRSEFQFLLTSTGRQIFLDHSGANGGVRDLIDQDETARCPIARIRIKEKRNVSFEFDRSYIVHVQLRCQFLVERVDIHAMMNP